MEILQEGPKLLPRCDQFKMHIPVAKLFKHRRTYRCNKAMERQIRQRDVEMVERCVYMEFSLYGGEGEDIVE